MFSNLADRVRHTAAWRLSVLTALAFAAGAGGTFLGAYLFVAHLIQERSDMWLRGESRVLLEVAENAPSNDIHDTVVEEVADLVRFEVNPGSVNGSPPRLPVFFLILPDSGGPTAWVGPGSADRVAAALAGTRFRPDEPFFLALPGWRQPFRVIARTTPSGETALLGFIDQTSLAALAEVRWIFFWLWVGMLAFGFAVSWFGTRNILRRVEEVTATANRIGSENLHHRVAIRSRYDDEISRLAATFNSMLQRLEKAVGQIRSVTDSLAHDIRSPLTAIRGNLELALNGGDPDRLRDSAAEAMEQLDLHLQGIESILDVAESEAGALRIHRGPVDLAGLLAEMIDFFRPAFEEQGLELRMGGNIPSMQLSLDRHLIQRALGNLFENAMHHLPPGCRVTLFLETDGDTVNLTVADDGPGFPVEIRDQAFGRFVKGPGSKGYGLGLSLVQAVARSHGGSARILDNPGGGTRIRMSLPRCGA